MNRILAVIAVAGLSVVTRGQEASYTQGECIEMALKNGAVARSAAIDESIAEARVKQARSVALPKLSASASYTRLDELQEVDFDGELLEVGTLNNYSAGAEVNQVLFAGGKVAAALRAAGMTRRQASASRREADSEVRRHVTQLFNSILLADARVRVLEESLALLEELVAQTEERKKADKASEFDLLSAQVRFENEKPQVIQARNALAVAKQRMAKSAGIPEPSFLLAGELVYSEVTLNEEELLAEAMECRPLLQAAREAGLLRGEDVAATRADQLPSLSAFASYNGANSYGFVSFGDEEWEWHWNAGLALTWNLWDGGMTRGLLYEKKLQHQKAMVMLEDIESEVVLQVRTAVRGITDAAESVRAASKNVALAEKAMEIAFARYEEGMSTYLEYTEANVELKRARLAYLVSVAAHLGALADLEHAVGKKVLRVEEMNGDIDE